MGGGGGTRTGENLAVDREIDLASACPMLPPPAFGVCVLGFEVWGLEFGAGGLGFGVWGLGVGVGDLGFGFGFWVWV